MIIMLSLPNYFANLTSENDSTIYKFMLFISSSIVTVFLNQLIYPHALLQVGYLIIWLQNKSREREDWLGEACLPNIIAVSAVVPEEREDSREHLFAKAASVSMKDLATAFSSAKGKSASSTITLGNWSRTNCAAAVPPCPSNTCYSKLLITVLDCTDEFHQISVHFYTCYSKHSHLFPCFTVCFPCLNYYLAGRYGNKTF